MSTDTKVPWVVLCMTLVTFKIMHESKFHDKRFLLLVKNGTIAPAQALTKYIQPCAFFCQNTPTKGLYKFKSYLYSVRSVLVHIP